MPTSQLADPRQALVVAGEPAVDDVEDDALQQLAKRLIAQLGSRLEHLDQPLLQTHAGLHTVDDRAVPAGRRPRQQGSPLGGGRWRTL